MFYIRDCNEQIVGNPNGYRTMRGASSVYNNPKTAAYKAIQDAFHAREDYYEKTCMPLPLRRRGISSIRLNEEA